MLFGGEKTSGFQNPYAGAVKLLLLAAFDFEVVCILDWCTKSGWSW